MADDAWASATVNGQKVEGYFGIVHRRGEDNLGEFFMRYPDKSVYTFANDGRIHNFKPGGPKSKRLDDVKVATDAESLIKNPEFGANEIARLNKNYPSLSDENLSVYKNAIARAHSLGEAWPGATLRNGTKLEAYFGYGMTDKRNKLSSLFVRYPDRSTYTFNEKGDLTAYNPGRNQGDRLPAGRVAADAAELLHNRAYQKQELTRLNRGDTNFSSKDILDFSKNVYVPARPLRVAP
jgi:hypothetical protein